jgi:hypothetical protein
MHRSTSSTLTLAVVTLLGALGCSDGTGPDDAIARQATPFYYYEKRPIYLTVDPRRVSVEVTGDAPTVVRAALAARGIAVDSLTAIGQRPTLRLAWLGGPSSARTATAAAAALRLTDGVTFASATYFPRDGDATLRACPLVLLNRLAVAFRSDARAADIDALNARVGTTRSPDQFVALPAAALSYPVHSTYTPLEIAAYYERSSLVDWADADRTSCVVVLQ